MEIRKTRVYLPTQNNNIMTQSTNITSELIQSMYNSTNNKMRFIQVFGTTRFRFQSEETLNRMFQYLQTKNK